MGEGRGEGRIFIPDGSQQKAELRVILYEGPNTASSGRPLSVTWGYTALLRKNTSASVRASSGLTEAPEGQSRTRRKGSQPKGIRLSWV